MLDYAIGVDLGGTNLRAAAISRDGQLLRKVTGATNLSAGRDVVITDIVNGIAELRAECGTDRLVGVGIGVPGFILMEQGFIVGAHNLPEFHKFPVRDVISQQLGAPVILENDANAAALGERWMGAGRGFDDLLMLTLGTGIGGGIIIGGKVLHGYVGMAGEIGHITVNPNGNPCGCGNFGCLEKYASATAVVAQADMLRLGSDLTAKDVYNLAIQGDDRAKTVFVSMGRALGIALASLINIFNFPIYLLSGGMLPAWDLFAPTMLAEVEQRSFTYRNAVTRIEKAIMGNEAGLYGAAYLPFQAQSLAHSG
jgi:glucokinase